MSTVDRAHFTFTHRLRVRWAEVDRQDVVFNANYFLYFDVAVAEYWRAIGFVYPGDYIERHGTDIFAVKSTAEYHGSATYEEQIDVGCRAARIGRTSLALQFGIWRGDEHITSGEIVYVNVDVRSRKASPWPETLTSLIRSFERTPPD